MSLALVRQALAFVDPEETAKVTGKKRRVDSSRPQSVGQAFVASSHLNKQKNKKRSIPAVLHKEELVEENIKKFLALSVSHKEELVEENIKKFLALSTPTANKAVAEKIVQRAIKGKPLLDEKIEVKDTKEKSILFPEENCTSKKTKRHKKK